MQQINSTTLFKFTDQLGALLRRYCKSRLQTLLDQKKAGTLTLDKALKLEAICFASSRRVIGELDEILSYINVVMATRANEHS